MKRLLLTSWLAAILAPLLTVNASAQNTVETKTDAPPVPDFHRVPRAADLETGVPYGTNAWAKKSVPPGDTSSPDKTTPPQSAAQSKP